MNRLWKGRFRWGRLLLVWLVFLSDTVVTPTAVLKLRLRSCEKEATNSALLIGCESEDTT